MSAASGSNQRANDCAKLRRDAALAGQQATPQNLQHPNNQDENLYPNKIGNYSKGLPHNNDGSVFTYLQGILPGNPVAALVLALRSILLHALAPPTTLLVKLALCSVTMFVAGIIIFGRLKTRFYDYV